MNGQSEILDAILSELGIRRQYPGAWVSIARIYFDYRHTGRKAVLLARLGQYWRLRGARRLADFIQAKLRREFGCYISLTARIGPGLKLPHPIGVVIGDGVRLGERCTVFQHVTIGGARLGDGVAGRYPRIGDEVTIFAGACLLGNIEVGRGARIAANSVVRQDVPAAALAAGIPAQIKLPRSA